MKGLKEKALSRVGREVLIRSVIRAIPSYIMRCFETCKGICRKIEWMINCFNWGRHVSKRSLYWLNIENMAARKLEGDLASACPQLLIQNFVQNSGGDLF